MGKTGLPTTPSPTTDADRQATIALGEAIIDGKTHFCGSCQKFVEVYWYADSGVACGTCGAEGADDFGDPWLVSVERIKRGREEAESVRAEEGDRE